MTKTDDVPVKDTTELKALLELDLMSTYNGLDQLGKQAFWRAIIDRIEIKQDNELVLHFL